MTVSEARWAAAVIGCDHFLLVRTGAHRRAALSRADYYESFAFLYLIDGRSGEMIAWIRQSLEADSQGKADEALLESVAAAASELTRALHDVRTAKSDARATGPIEEVPADGSPAAKDLKPPIPYKRIKPEYTSTAFLYSVRATIDIEADIGADGTVLATRIVRWAGFDLETAAETAVRDMSWRPAMRNGKPLAMRVLLRYNFTKVDKEQ
jgi:hypothetical protein